MRALFLKRPLVLVLMVGLMTLLLFGFNNPSATSFKVILYCTVLLSGFYTFKLTQWLFHAKPIALLCSVVYVFSPYFLMNMTTLHNSSAIISQAILPVTLFYTLITFKGPRFATNILTICSWMCLCITDLVSFLASTLFIGLFIGGLVFFDRTLLRHAVKLASLYLLGCLLGVIALFFSANTPDLAALSQTNLPTIHYIGWPLLFAVLVLIHLLLQKRLVFIKGSKKAVVILLTLFSMAFMAGTFLHFFQLIPTLSMGAQLNHALLLQMIWMGTLLFGWMLLEMTRGKLSLRYALFGTVLIGLFSL